MLRDEVIEKVSNFCHVKQKQVVCVPDVTSIYRVPLMLEDQKVVEFFAARLQLPLPTLRPRKFLMKWRDLADRSDRMMREVTICLVGKYTKLEDSYTSVVKALRHAALACNHRLDLKCIEATDLELDMKQENAVRYHEAWQQLCSSNGVIIPGGFGNRGMEGKILAAEWARKTKKPFLGVCLGLQCAVIEFARNVLGWHDAHSTEADDTTQHPVVIEMPEHHPGQLGGTMRLGKRRTIFRSDQSLLRKLYRGAEFVEERHRHRYEVNPSIVSKLEAAGMLFVGHDVDGKRMEIMELRDHPYYIAVQYHP
jgi:CTP synthase